MDMEAMLTGRKARNVNTHMNIFTASILYECYITIDLIAIGTGYISNGFNACIFLKENYLAS